MIKGFDALPCEEVVVWELNTTARNTNDRELRYAGCSGKMNSQVKVYLCLLLHLFHHASAKVLAQRQTCPKPKFSWADTKYV